MWGVLDAHPMGLVWGVWGVWGEQSVPEDDCVCDARMLGAQDASQSANTIETIGEAIDRLESAGGSEQEVAHVRPNVCTHMGSRLSHTSYSDPLNTNSSYTGPFMRRVACV